MTETSFEKAERIKTEVAEKYGFTVEQLVRARRTVPLSFARFETMYRLRNETDMGAKSLNWIGSRMGNRDHATVHSGIQRFIQITAASDCQAVAQ